MLLSYGQIIIIILFLLLLLLLCFKLGKRIGTIVTQNYWQKQLPSLRKEIANSSRSIIKGQVAEQLAPYLPNFPFNPAECKFLGNPIDFIVFRNLEKKEESAIIFVEVKSGQSQLNTHERNLKQAIKNKNVFWYEYRL
jgi:predicted Holliday junction resolvase-like endonuclease